MTLSAGQPIRLEIVSTPAHLPVVRAAVEKLCTQLGFGADVAGQVALSLDEALANVIKHAYEGAEDRPVEITLIPTGDADPTGIEIRVRDHGRRVDRARIRSRDLNNVRPGGLGVHIISEYMDSLDYQPADGGGTVLTMTKRLPETPQTGSSS